MFSRNSGFKLTVMYEKKMKEIDNRATWFEY